MRTDFDERLAPNQSPPYVDHNLFTEDAALLDATAGIDADFSALGADYGAAERLDEGRLANENPPRLRVVDARGNRIDMVEFHPAYHALMRRGIAGGLHSAAWSAWGAAPQGHRTRAAHLYIATQAESGHICPLTMTNASVAALMAEPEVARRWLPKILGRAYDPAQRPWWEKGAVTLGMGMTEAQGGTDVRANESQAVAREGGYAITGRKWFMSAPMCDAFLVLAQAPGGLTCFLTPRFRPDGALNGIYFQRLKDKLGNRSNASSEVEFHGAFAERVGPEGHGVRTILEMVQLTRLDCVVASAGQMRFALALAVHHARHRIVFQRRLVDQPLMRAVLADLALESEASTALAFRLARAFDSARADGREAAYARLITPAAKYLVCKAAPNFIYEALECHGGNGYVEEWPLARAYREAPLNAIWEGSGNVMALDVLRAIGKAPEETRGLVARLAETCGLDAATLGLSFDGASPAGAERMARRTAERLGRLAAAAALSERRPELAEAYARTRLLDDQRTHYGASDLADVEALLMARVLPEGGMH